MISIADIDARTAIAELKARYCRTLDAKDWQAFKDLFTEDVEFDTRPSGGTLARGREEVLRVTRASIETAITAHQVHSAEIELKKCSNAWKRTPANRGVGSRIDRRKLRSATRLTAFDAGKGSARRLLF